MYQWGPLYDNLVRERYDALLASQVFLKYRRKWLSAFGRFTPFLNMDHWTRFEVGWKSDHSQQSRCLEQDIQELSTSFAISTWHIIWALFIKDFSPLEHEATFFPMDLRHPRLSVAVTGREYPGLDQLSGALTGTGIQLILEPQSRLQICSQDYPELFIRVELPLEIPLFMAVNLVRAGRRKVIQVLRNNVPSSRLAEDEPKVHTALACYGGTEDFKQRVSKASSQLTVDLIEVYGPPESSSHYSNLRIWVDFSPADRASDVVRETRKAVRGAREVVRDMGLNMSDRLRSAPLTALSTRLAVNGDSLPSRGIGDLIMDETGEFPVTSETNSLELSMWRSSIKSRRNQILQRFRSKGLIP